MPIVRMGRFTAIGMRTKVTDPAALIINTCSHNDSSEIGDLTHWSWSNPTNRAVPQRYQDVEAVSTECNWQGAKLMVGQDRPDPTILAGAWRKNKGRRPVGAYAGPGQPLITSPGLARRLIYLPAFRHQIVHWLNVTAVTTLVLEALEHDGDILLRDHDTGRGLDRNGPLSHAWILAEFFNHKGVWPDEVNSRDALPLELLIALDLNID